MLDPTLEVSSVKAFKGELVDVTVSVKDNPGIIAASLSISYDNSKLSLIKVTNGTIFGANSFLAGNDLKAVPYTVLWEDALATTDYTEDGVMVTFTFEILEEAETGKTPVTLTYSQGSTFNSKLNDVAFATADGIVDIFEHIPGDATGNGEIDLKDVVAIQRFLAGGFDVEIDPKSADVNGDGELNLKDAVIIKRYLAGGWGIEL